jgi:hypothetical protein
MVKPRRRATRGLRRMALVFLLAVAMLGVVSPSEPGGGATRSLAPTSGQQFGFNGGATQTYTVPTDGRICALRIQAAGASGGSAGASHGGAGGSGSGTFDVHPGDIVTVDVGSHGGDASGAAGGSGGVGGGAAGGQAGPGGIGGGGGGGATTIRLNGTVVVVGGGGGGAAINTSAGSAGSSDTAAPPSRPGGSGLPAATGGDGAPVTAPGAGGGAGGGTATAGGPGVAATGGTGGNGGTGDGGGGGGGGLFGAGGGGGGDATQAGGGGAGSTFVGTDFTEVPNLGPDFAGNGQASIGELCWQSVTVTHTVVGTPPAGTTFRDVVVCENFGRQSVVTFDATGAPTSNNVVHIVDPSFAAAPCMLTPRAIGPLQPFYRVATCVPKDVCGAQLAGGSAELIGFFPNNRQGMIGTLNITDYYAVLFQPNFTG